MVAAWILAGAALAGGDRLNREPMIVASLVHQGGADAPWGVEVGAQQRYLLGDSCGYSEYPDCRSATWWPTAGPRAAVTWRGGDRVGLDVEVVGGVGALDTYQFGFFPIFELDATVGAGVEWGSQPAFLFGGRVTKSLSVTSRVGGPESTATRTYGLAMLAGTFALQERWSGAPLVTRWKGGLQMSTLAGSYD